MVSYGYWHQLNALERHGGPRVFFQDFQERRSGDHRQRPGQSHHAVLRGLYGHGAPHRRRGQEPGGPQSRAAAAMAPWGMVGEKKRGWKSQEIWKWWEVDGLIGWKSRVFGGSLGFEMVQIAIFGWKFTFFFGCWTVPSLVCPTEIDPWGRRTMTWDVFDRWNGRQHCLAESV